MIPIGLFVAGIFLPKYRVPLFIAAGAVWVGGTVLLAFLAGKKDE